MTPSSPNLQLLAGPMRQARQEVMPRVPELTHCLRDEPEAVSMALADSLRRQGVDPQALSASNRYKLERHTVAAYFIHQQRKALTIGEGPDARFRSLDQTQVVIHHPDGTVTPQENSAKVFSERIYSTQMAGAQLVVAQEGGIFARARQRYNHLGALSLKLDGNKVVPREGQDLHRALLSRALSSFTLLHLNLLNLKLPSGEGLQPKAAFDLAHLPTGFASLHFVEFRHSLIDTVSKTNAALRRCQIATNQKDRYVLAAASPEDHKTVHPRLEALPNSRLKCPAHTLATPEEGEATSPAFTNLQSLVFATLHAAVEQRLLT